MTFRDDFTDFQNGQRNGWENGPGVPDGKIELENGNYFWRGDLKVPSKAWPTIQPSLMKRFDILDKERQDYYDIVFTYRVHRLQEGEASELAITVCPEAAHFSANIAWLEIKTEPGRWQKAIAKERWFRRSSVLWIGTQGGMMHDHYRKIDIDYISVTRIAN